MVVSPGRTEPIEKYFETAADLNGRGWTVVAHDWRGQGLSARLLPDPTPGHAIGYRDFLTDYRALLDAFAARLPQPWIGLGHSMGGCLTLLALAEGERRLAAAILSAPMLGLSTGRVPLWAARIMARGQRLAGRGARLAAAAEAEPQSFAANILTHDAERFARNEALLAAAPQLGLGAPTWGWVDFAFDAISRLQRGPAVRRIGVPVTFVLAGEEKLVDNGGARMVAARLPNARLVEIPGAYHELLQETDPVRAAFFAEFDRLAAGLA